MARALGGAGQGPPPAENQGPQHAASVSGPWLSLFTWVLLNI